MNNHLIHFLLIILSFPVSAQIYPAARYAAMGNTGAALQGLESLTANVAGIASLQTTSVAAYYQAQFVNTDVGTKGLLAAVPTSLGVFGAHAFQYGLRGLYSEMKVSGAYAKAFANHLYAALTASYHQVRITDYGEGQTYSFDVGLQYRIKQRWALGVHVENLGSASYDYSVYAPIPVQLRLGTSCQVHEGLTITADVEKVLYRKKTDVRMGIEYQPSTWMYLRGGMGLNEFTQCCGIGLAYRKMVLDMAAIVHARLGVSPQLLFAYAF